jgi:3-oxochol-4-en-24-oyl-CoA dehydrogenase
MAAGASHGSRDMAVEYAKGRVAFGRPVAQFQAIKHYCATMFVEEQLAAGAVWDAARGIELDPFAVDCAVAVSVGAFVRNARQSIQIHGGIAITWEHDAHLYLRRADALAALAGGVEHTLATVATTGSERGDEDGVALPEEAERYRMEARAHAERYWALADSERHAYLVEAGILYPHWPKPWGIGADTVQQLVLKEELAGIPRFEPLGPTAWELPIILPTIITHGTDDQLARWIRPTMNGDISWCQLFSEPGAGSDLAGVRTRARPTDGGWLLTGQKVWTSTAEHAKFGLALVRTSTEGPKHAGLTCMVVSMNDPGVEIRPLRQITGASNFNEVFLTDVFVPDDDVIGSAGQGWEIARTTLDFERSSVGSVNTRSDQPAAIKALNQARWSEARQEWSRLREAASLSPSDSHLRVALGSLVSVDRSLKALMLRALWRSVARVTAGAEGTVLRLVMTGQVQRMAELSLANLGVAGVYADGSSTGPVNLYLQSRETTIAGGTSEILRNVVAERILGMPKEPKVANA